MKRMTLLAGAALALALSACGDEKKDAPSATPSGTAAAQKPTSAVAAPPSRTAQAVAQNDDDIPSEVDFEEEAEKDITADSVESELSKLEKELGP
jgi:uncharacterized lipoprotein YbaY